MWLTVSYAAVLGLCVGSFANVVIYRMPKNQSIVSPPSHCPNCKKQLAARDLIPIVSHMLLRGKCRYCFAPISLRYVITELCCAVLFGAMTVYAGGILEAVPLYVLSFVLLCLSFIDMDTQEIPDQLLVVLALAGAAQGLFTDFFAPSLPLLPDGLLGALWGAAPLFIIDRLALILIKQDGFGFGDVKMMAASGLFLGWRLALVSLLFAILSGGTFAIYLLISKRAGKGDYMAFGPFLAFGVLASLIIGEVFISFLFP